MGLLVYFFYQSPKELNIEVPGKGENRLSLLLQIHLIIILF